MAFESLSQKLQNIFNNLRGKGKLSENDVKLALKEVKMALLSADVNFKVVKEFINNVTERAVGSEVLDSLTPGQQVIKIVNEELIKLMGESNVSINVKSPGDISLIMMVGLQGAGKTTTAAKLAAKYKANGYKPLLVACDIYRPAAIEQLKINANKQGIDFFEQGTDKKPVEIVNLAIDYARNNKNDILIIDTAGRLHIDEDMMQELSEIKNNLDIDSSILVVDGMTGQDAVNVAVSFDEKIGIDGVIITKLDGDARGGAVLSIKSVTKKPIFYVGMGEKLSDLDLFYPDRMASRILGMGDILSLIEKVEKDTDKEKAKEMEKKLKSGDFNFNDFIDQMQQMKKLGGISGILSMLPNVPNFDESMIDEKHFSRVEAIILSMSKEERLNPALLNPSRKNRIARGAGVDISEVNRIVKQFEMMKKMMKQMSGINIKKRGGMFGNLFKGKGLF